MATAPHRLIVIFYFYVADGRFFFVFFCILLHSRLIVVFVCCCVSYQTAKNGIASWPRPQASSGNLARLIVVLFLLQQFVSLLHRLVVFLSSGGHTALLFFASAATFLH